MSSTFNIQASEGWDISVENNEVILNFSLASGVSEIGPQGPQGPQGPEGPQGPPGLDTELTEADRIQTGLDRIQTGLDAEATAADRTQTGLDRVQTGLDVIATAADRVQTGLDVIATGDDRVQTGADRIQTGLDAQATDDDRNQTGLDAIATAADRVQTGLDVIAANEAKDDAESAAAAVANNVDFTGTTENDLLQADALGVFVPKSPTLVNKSLTPFLNSPLLPYLNPNRLESDWGNTTDAQSQGSSQPYTLVDGYKTLLMNASFGTMEFSFIVGGSDVSNFFNFAIMNDENNYYFFRFDRSKFQLSQKIDGVTTLLQTTNIPLSITSRVYVQKVTLAWTFDSSTITNFSFGGRTINRDFNGNTSSPIITRNSVVRLGFLTTTGNVNYLITS